MLITTTDLPEWMAIARMAQIVDVSQPVKEELAAYAAIAPRDARRTAALLAIAHQDDAIRSRDWLAFRRALGRSTSEAWRRDLLADAAAMRVSLDAAEERRSDIDELRSLWNRELTPIIRLGLGRTLQLATLCAIASCSEVETLN